MVKSQQTRELLSHSRRQITNAVVCGDSLIATWVDHELRLARMAKISLDDEMKNGISKAQLRLNRNTAMVEGATWCHILDAEPLALTSQDDKIFFALWSKGMYCIDSDSNEIWRLPLFDSMANHLHDQKKLLQYQQ